jgi:peptide/nickel transport system permease protein
MVTDITAEGVADSGGVEAAIEKFRAKWGLDKSWPEQYWIWIKGFATLDFGEEFSRPGVAISGELWRRLKITIPLTLISVLLSYLLALPLGILSAVKQGSWTDRITTFFLFMLYSLPTFWVGLLLILAFGASGLDWLPILGLHDKDAGELSRWDWWVDFARHAILPIATLTYGGLAYLSRQMRVGMLETVRQDYIRTARAKGLAEKTVVMKHAVRNSLIPVITVFAQILPLLIGGSVIVETVFDIPGMGLYAFEGLLKRDYNVVMATTTVSALMTMVGFLVSDVLYAVVDPRISYD